MFNSDTSVYAINSETPFTCRFAKDSTQPLDWGQSIPVLGLSSLCKEPPVSESAAPRAAQMYRQQTCSSNLQMKCKTGNDRWWGQTGKSKEQSNSTSRASDSGHSAAGCDWGSLTVGCRGSKERMMMMMMMRGCASVGQEFALIPFFIS